MEREPPKADPPKRKRRWFQFSLRTLMIFTLICAVAAGWLGKWIEQKRIEPEEIGLHVGMSLRDARAVVGEVVGGGGNRRVWVEWFRLTKSKTDLIDMRFERDADGEMRLKSWGKIAINERR